MQCGKFEVVRRAEQNGLTLASGKVTGDTSFYCVCARHGAENPVTATTGNIHCN